MTRRRAGLAVVVVVVVALLGLGIWRRQQLVDERDAARVARRHALATLALTRVELARTSRRAGAIESASVTVRAEAADLRTVADDVAAQVTAVTKERDDAALATYFANGQVGTLRTCLDGINRALNQVSVGDPNSVGTLETVRNACRAVS
jgi:hypothetical protein